MNEKFFELPGKKQKAIVDASLEVFGTHDYKYASTVDIALKAGISKGLLFYYFHNKKDLYLYVYQYCVKLMHDSIKSYRFDEITDFFEVMEFGAEMKLKIVTENPYLMEFVMKAFMSQGEEISQPLAKNIQETISTVYDVYFKNMDTSKFREGVDPVEMLKMLTWMTEGYAQEKLRGGQSLKLAEVMDDYHRWVKMFKKIAYKEEFQ